MENLEDTFTVSVIGNGLGVTAGAIQDLIRDAHLQNPSIASGLALAKITVLSVGAEGFSVAIAVQSGDPDRIGKASTAAIASIVLSTVGAIGVGVFGTGAITAAIVVGGAGYFGTKLGKQIWEHYKESVTTGIAPPPNVVMPDGMTDFDFYRVPGLPSVIDPICRRDFDLALNWRQPRDPLILDLDGDGIELSTSNSAILFDHNFDGIKTGSQWAKADDGMLVRDLDGNGLIDSGRELFGDQTLLANGQRAANGFAALSELDSNADRTFDTNDSAYADLRVWRDLNQDGISQSGELQSLSDAGITAISLNANTQGIGSYTQTVTNPDGSSNSTNQTLQNVNLTSNNFYREFSDDPAVTTADVGLPQMQIAINLVAVYEYKSGTTGQLGCGNSILDDTKKCTRWLFDRSKTKTARARSMRFARHKTLGYDVRHGTLPRIFKTKR